MNKDIVYHNIIIMYTRQYASITNYNPQTAVSKERLLITNLRGLLNFEDSYSRQCAQLVVAAEVSMDVV